MLELSLLVVCVLFSCLALVLSLYSVSRTLQLNEYRNEWRRLGESYAQAHDTFHGEYNRIDGDLDRCKDKLEMLDKNFRRFRSRVTMQERRAEPEPVETPSHNAAPLTEAQKDEQRLKLHGQRFGMPRDTTED